MFKGCDLALLSFASAFKTSAQRGWSEDESALLGTVRWPGNFQRFESYKIHECSALRVPQNISDPHVWNSAGDNDLWYPGSERGTDAAWVPGARPRCVGNVDHPMARMASCGCHSGIYEFHWRT